MERSPAEAFGQALREARLKAGLSQEEAASLGGLDRAYLGHLERASKTPTISTVWKVAEAVEVKPSQLIARAERILAKRG
jgi:XRE family transcriptional regulator, regulator of sulfur utilization